VVAAGGKLYVFGGSTGPFDGAVTNAAVYTPATNTWAVLSPMPVARGGPTAQLASGKIYVVGGMDGAGASLETVSIYGPGTNTWAAGPSLGTRRDNPGSAVPGGKIFVFGGRTRNAAGTTPNGTLSTTEMLDPIAATPAWASRAAMPTGRRTMAVGLPNGRAQLMGGEITTLGGAFAANEEYDPIADTWRPLPPMATPRHGIAAGTIAGTVYTAGGGTTGGTSFSTTNDAFTLGG
jgi:hypothetical protein